MNSRFRERLGQGPGGVPSIRDVVGAPLLPPPLLASALERLRAMILWWHRVLAPPPLRILEAALAPLDFTVVAALVSLDVPDHLRAPMSVDQLAQRTGADGDVLRRLVDFASVSGWLHVDRRGRVHPTRLTRFLRRDHPGGWRAWVEFAKGSEVHGALGRLAIDPSSDSFRSVNGLEFFDWLTTHPDRHDIFDAAMSAGGHLHGHALARALDWDEVQVVCDVGGGSGATLAVLLDVHPHLRGVLFDLPEVVARGPRRERMDSVGGDAFAGLPDGCDTYLFVNVIHDWDDEAAVRLLASAAQTSPRVRVILVENDKPPRARARLASRTDILMLALAPGGRERTRAQVSALAKRSGLQLIMCTPLASGDIAYTLTRLPPAGTAATQAGHNAPIHP